MTKVASLFDIKEPTAAQTGLTQLADLHLIGKGAKSIAGDLEAALRKIEAWHQGSIAGFRIMYRDSDGY